ncbi:MAG: RpiB/LacA/LacB family sugar-phosphate isomerase [Patescibacteria group bacterium]|nr:RpiB/LacA/LacB family sugar-phosphate isomerase [Patescibacteria group bacterium]MDE2172776.1 RpiB/LacA/LacB family sugar-phosphate isomerase [Patescibacteria group bacterium]
MKSTIILAADHAGFELKEAIKKFLEGRGEQVFDVGAHELKPEDDYPEYMTAAAMKVASDMKGQTRAIIFGGSGQGEAMVANRFPGVRAVVWYGGGDSASDSHESILKLSREHNNSNVLSIGARFVSEDQAKHAVLVWLETPFSNEERHARRIEEIDSIE